VRSGRHALKRHPLLFQARDLLGVEGEPRDRRLDPPQGGGDDGAREVGGTVSGRRAPAGR
jgi:hypothetical protein